MINFTNQSLHLAQRIQEHISYSPLLIPDVKSRISGYLVDAWTLLHSYAFSAPGLSDFIFVDLPRASANGSAQVFAIDANEDIIKKEIRWEDPDYLTLISAS